MTDRVEIYAGWFGVLLTEGADQSLVRVTKCDDDSLIGKEIVFMNRHLRIRRDEDMATVQDMTNQYNEMATARGLPSIKKFKDKATAERRLAAISSSSKKADDPTAVGTRAVEIEVKPKNSGGTPAKAEVNKENPFQSPDRKKLYAYFLERTDKWIAASSLKSLRLKGNDDAIVGGILWASVERKIPEGLEFRKNKIDGKTHYGLFRK